LFKKSGIRNVTRRIRVNPEIPFQLCIVITSVSRLDWSVVVNDLFLLVTTGKRSSMGQVGPSEVIGIEVPFFPLFLRILGIAYFIKAFATRTAKTLAVTCSNRMITVEDTETCKTTKDNHMRQSIPIVDLTQDGSYSLCIKFETSVSCLLDKKRELWSQPCTVWGRAQCVLWRARS
jgi:hypothetical protein